jgi:protein-S-isoprenylcysteine O-methyltransferase Ste14
MTDNTQALDQESRVSMNITPHVLAAGMAAICLAAHGFVLGWPEFELMQSFAAVVVVFLSAVLIAYAARSYRQAGLPFRPFDDTQPLLTDGAYRFSRSPVYVGMAGLLGGLAILFSSYAFLGATVVFLVYVHLTYVLPAERHAEEAYGQDFDRYKVRVHRWL